MTALASRADETRAEIATLSFPYLHRLIIAATWVAVAVGLVGTAITREPLFAVGYVVAVAVDVALVRGIVTRAEAAHDVDPLASARALPLLVGARIAVKAILMLLAALVLGAPALMGAAFGALVVDTTFLVAAPVLAAWSVFGRPTPRRPERGE